MVRLRDFERIPEGQYVGRIYRPVLQVLVTGSVHTLRVVIPARLAVVLGAAEQELDHVAFVVRSIGGRSVPQVVVREGDSAGLDGQGDLAFDVRVGGILSVGALRYCVPGTMAVGPISGVMSVG